MDPGSSAASAAGAPPPPPPAAAGATAPGTPGAQPPVQQPFDVRAYKQALHNTAAETFANTASLYAASPAQGALPNPPNLLHVILCDHAMTLTLFSRFFQDAVARNTNIMSLAAGALALEQRLHSQAEMQVLYPILTGRLGAEGAALAQRALTEHALLEASIEDVLRLRGSPNTAAFVDRVKQMQTEFMTHQAEEETLVLPRVADVCTEAELVQMALAFKQIKQTAPLFPQVMAAQAAAAAAASAAAAAPPPPDQG